MGMGAGSPDLLINFKTPPCISGTAKARLDIFHANKATREATQKYVIGTDKRSRELILNPLLSP